MERVSETRVLGRLLGEAGVDDARSVMDEPLSLIRTRCAYDLAAVLSESLNSVAESVVDMDALGEPGRPYELGSRYARSLSARCLTIVYLFISVPFAVSVGLVMGAEITALGLLRSPCDTVFTVTGERDAGPSLWYGTDRSLRSFEDTDDWRGLFFFLPKNESMLS